MQVDFDALTSQWPDAAIAQLRQLTTPSQVQDWLNQVPVREQGGLRSPLSVMRDRQIGVLDGALWAAAALRRLGFPPTVAVWAGPEELHAAAVFVDASGWALVSHHPLAELRLGDRRWLSLSSLLADRALQVDASDVPQAVLDLQQWDACDWLTDDQQLSAVLQALEAQLGLA